MKKYLAAFLALVMAVCICGCGGETDGATDGTEKTELTLQEVSGIVAIERLTDYMDDTLADPDSFEILSMTSVNCYDSTFALKVDYSVANRMGGKDRDTAYLRTAGILMCECSLFEENPVLAGVTLENIANAYKTAVTEGTEEVELDVDKLMDNLDLSEDERTQILNAYLQQSE